MPIEADNDNKHELDDGLSSVMDLVEPLARQCGLPIETFVTGLLQGAAWHLFRAGGCSADEVAAHVQQLADHWRGLAQEKEI